MAPPPPRRHAPDAARRSWRWSAVIALIEVVLSLADAGILFDPSLRQPGLHGRRLLGEPAARRHAALCGAAGHHVPEPRLPARLAAAHGDEHDDPARARPLHRRPLRARGRSCRSSASARSAAARSTGCSPTGPIRWSGASGAVFAFLGLWIAWDWRRHRGRALSTGPVLRRVGVLVLDQRRHPDRAEGDAGLGGASRRLPRRARLRLLDGGPAGARRARGPRRGAAAARRAAPDARRACKRVASR